MSELSCLGRDWLADQVSGIVDSVEHIGPVEFCEKNRYLPAGVTRFPGYIRFDRFPFWKEPLSCFDPAVPVREVNIMKGVQVGYTTLMECVIFYYAFFVKTAGIIYFTAEKELAITRMENNILPMIAQSDMGHNIQSADVGNLRKTGKKTDHLQWAGGGFLLCRGANNARKMRQDSAPVILKDELDGWDRSVGKDGNSDILTDARCDGYESKRKILRGSTPLWAPSMTEEAYLRGDQRQWMVLCKRCGFPQTIKMRKPEDTGGVPRGILWELEGGRLVHESVRYACVECGHEHFEADKTVMLSDTRGGAHWKPTATPHAPGIRSYHLPSWNAPYGSRSWAKCVREFLAGYDPETKTTRSIDQLQVFYNNVLGKPFKQPGARVSFQRVSSHRRPEYSRDQVPNGFAEQHAGSKIRFLTAQIDVHKSFLAVAVFGWAEGCRAFLIDRYDIERLNDDDDCSQLDSPVWQRVRELIEERVWKATDGTEYRLIMTFVDASWSNDAVTQFCSEYVSGVYPILGRQRPDKNQTISEFAQYTTKLGTIGFRLTVDHYKDRASSVLRREWFSELGERQSEHHFNAPIDLHDKFLKELTVEYRVEELDKRGNTVYRWHRPGGVKNELWDLLCYGYASVEVLAWHIFKEEYGIEQVDWTQFWEFVADPANDARFGRSRGSA